jgi:hypothetical protein
VKKYLLPLAAIAAVSTAPAFAATFIQSQTINSAGAGTDTLLTFAKFDASLGTLDSVTLSFDANMAPVSGEVDNNAAAAKDFTVTTGASVGLAGQGFNLAATLGQGSSKIHVLGKKQGGTAVVGPFSGVGSGSATLVSGLSGFEGPGGVVFDFARASLFDVDMNGRITINPLVDGHATLTYSYTVPVVTPITPIVPPTPPAELPSYAVPEPATWAMLLIGFFGIGAALRRRSVATA